MSNGRKVRRKVAKDFVVEGTSWAILLSAPLIASGTGKPNQTGMRIERADVAMSKPLNDERPERRYSTTRLDPASYVVTGGTNRPNVFISYNSEDPHSAEEMEILRAMWADGTQRRLSVGITSPYIDIEQGGLVVRIPRSMLSGP